MDGENNGKPELQIQDLGGKNSYFWKHPCVKVAPKRKKNGTLPETKPASLHLKMDGWKTIVSFWDGLFLGANC